MKRWRVEERDAGTLGALVGDLVAIAEGRVFVGRKRVQDATFVLSVGDEVTMAPAAQALASSDVDVICRARDGELVAVNKPAGMPTIPDHGGASHSLLAHVARHENVPVERVHPTSRLDRDVSGVVIFALSPSAAARVADARDHGAYLRRYVALAARAPAPESGMWNAPIGRAKDPRHRLVGGRDAAHAETQYATIAVAKPGGQALLAIAPVTGRTHQIRVHASHANAPLLGDRVYGGAPRLTLPGGKVLALARVFLHCARVEVAGLVAVADVPKELRDAWSSLTAPPSHVSLHASLDAVAGHGPDAWAVAISGPLSELPEPLQLPAIPHLPKS